MLAWVHNETPPGQLATRSPESPVAFRGRKAVVLPARYARNSDQKRSRNSWKEPPAPGVGRAGGLTGVAGPGQIRAADSAIRRPLASISASPQLEWPARRRVIATLLSS